MVCLIASTCGSDAACSTNCSTEVEKESYGWCTSTSPLRSSRKKSGAGSVPCSTTGVCGTHGSSLSSGRSSAQSDQSPPRSSGPSTTLTSESDSSSSRQSSSSTSPVILVSTSSRT